MLVNEKIIFERAILIVKRGGVTGPDTDPECTHGPYCVGCCYGLAFTQLGCELGGVSNIEELRKKPLSPTIGDTLICAIQRGNALLDMRLPNEEPEIHSAEFSLDILTKCLEDAS
jgi:hypothetical protein